MIVILNIVTQYKTSVCQSIFLFPHLSGDKAPTECPTCEAPTECPPAPTCEDDPGTGQLSCLCSANFGYFHYKASLSMTIAMVTCTVELLATTVQKLESFKGRFSGGS